MILGFARDATYTVASNTRARGALPLWWFLLPSLEASTVRVLGAPTVLSAGLADLPLAPVQGDVPDLTYVTGAYHGKVPQPGPTELMVVEVARNQPDGNLGPDVGPLATVGGTRLYVPAMTPQTGGDNRARLKRVASRLQRRLLRDRTPPALAADTDIVEPRSLTTTTAYALVAGDGGDSRRGLERVPAYLGDLAAAHGHDLTGHTWRVVPPRGYRQQKVIVLTSPPDGGPEGIALKITQDPAVNPRLENEFNGLCEVLDRDLVPAGTIPRPLFSGIHAGLSIVGEQAVVGRRFMDTCDGSVRHPQAQEVVSWIDRLGVHSAKEIAGPEMGAALADLADRLGVIHGAEVAGPLHRDARRVAEVDRVPAVFGHGDPGFWNTIVTRDGTVVMCDWENAEPASPPLWDMVYFLQTYGAHAAGLRGRRYTATVFADQLLDPASPWAAWLWGTATGHADRIGLSHDLIVPMARSLWGFLALKEATRQTPQRLSSGRYARMLRAAAQFTLPCSD